MLNNFVGRKDESNATNKCARVGHDIGDGRGECCVCGGKYK